MKTILAIDPGVSGGFAWLRRNPDSVLDYSIDTLPMPATDGDVCDLLRELAPDVTYIEQVGGYTRREGGQPGSAMFKFGRGVGVIEGALLMARCRYILVRPQAWQKRLGVGTRGDRSITVWKNRLKAEAQRRFPQHKITLATADALLILDYAI